MIPTIDIESIGVNSIYTTYVLDDDINMLYNITVNSSVLFCTTVENTIRTVL